MEMLTPLHLFPLLRERGRGRKEKEREREKGETERERAGCMASVNGKELIEPDNMCSVSLLLAVLAESLPVKTRNSLCLFRGIKFYFVVMSEL